MTTDEVVNHYKTQTAVAKALNIKQASVSGWGEFPPDLRQLQIERLTKGKLKADPACKARLLGIAQKVTG